MRGIKIKKHKTKVKKGTLQNVNKNPSKTKKVNINKSINKKCLIKLKRIWEEHLWKF